MISFGVRVEVKHADHFIGSFLHKSPDYCLSGFHLGKNEVEEFDNAVFGIGPGNDVAVEEFDHLVVREEGLVA